MFIVAILELNSYAIYRWHQRPKWDLKIQTFDWRLWEDTTGDSEVVWISEANNLIVFKYYSLKNVQVVSHFSMLWYDKVESHSEDRKTWSSLLRDSIRVLEDAGAKSVIKITLLLCWQTSQKDLVQFPEILFERTYWKAGKAVLNVDLILKKILNLKIELCFKKLLGGVKK